MGAILKIVTILAATVVLGMGSASAMPLIGQIKSMLRSEIVVDAKIICEQDGYCFNRGRRPVARWVYGQGNFDDHYSGPGNYGRPGHHWIWWPFLGY
jgi:hypothetical protein